MAQTCAGCGAQLPEEARFCPACGRSVAAGSGEERRVVTILFADVADSTGLGERLDPEQLAEVMQAYFASMREEIAAEGGTVEKFIGDAVMAVFGVPVAHEDDASRALRAALRMRTRLARLNGELEESHSVRLAVRIGINTGEVVSTRSAAPGEAMVSGDAVNVAARLEQSASPGQVLVAERTSRAARGFSLRSLGPLALRGKDAGVGALELLGTAHARRRGIPGLHAPMVGRDAEVDLLRSLYARVAAEGRPHLVTVYGDPGVGKSRLVTEFTAWLKALDPPPGIVRGRCLPYGIGVTYFPLAEILKRGAGVSESDAPDVARQRVRDHCSGLLTAEVAADPQHATAVLGVTIGLEEVATVFGDVEPRQVRTHMHAAWRSYFAALAGVGPLVVVVEDIHWAEDALLDLLDEVADRVPGPALFVCPSRPELT
ncbi:MAG TPA: adenylate/guanylate cyclase domain-containing protein, partial [Candidatus Dormibacteraeota bacterium]